MVVGSDRRDIQGRQGEASAGAGFAQHGACILDLMALVAAEVLELLAHVGADAVERFDLVGEVADDEVVGVRARALSRVALSEMMC